MFYPLAMSEIALSHFIHFAFDRCTLLYVFAEIWKDLSESTWTFLSPDILFWWQTLNRKWEPIRADFTLVICRLIFPSTQWVLSRQRGYSEESVFTCQQTELRSELSSVFWFRLANQATKECVQGPRPWVWAGRRGEERRGEGGLNVSLVPKASFDLKQERSRSCSFTRSVDSKSCYSSVFQSGRDSSTRARSFCPHFWGIFLFVLVFSFFPGEPRWRSERRLTESGLTAGVGPENGGCYRKGMQRSRRTLPNCYRRHEGKPG